MTIKNVLLVGNCLSFGIDQIVRAYLPEAKVANAHFMVPDIVAFVAEAAPQADVILAQNGLDEAIYPRDLQAALEPYAGRTLRYPRLVFPAFHPDCVYGWNRVQAGANVTSPFSYHSAIVLEAYRRGYSAEDTLKLFNEDTFDALGYFDFFEPCLSALREECERAGLPANEFPGRWLGRPFMHTINHPRGFVAWDVGEYLLRKIGVRLPPLNPQRTLHDCFATGVQWPIYPEIARRLGVPGDYSFLPATDSAPGSVPTRHDLPAFIAACFRVYNDLTISEVGLSRPRPDRFDQVESDIFDRAFERGLASKRPGQHRTHPYTSLAAHQFWRGSISNMAADEVDPVVHAPFTIDPAARIVTAGSCFAQHIARSLRQNGYRYLVTETAPAEMSEAEAREHGYGVFSARYGNIYTARQLAQLVKRAYGEYAPLDAAWLRPDGRYVDPFRPQVEPAGYGSAEEVEAARQRHFVAVRALVEGADVFVFTLGLTEAWRRKADGAVFPLAPGVSAGTFDPALYEFVNFRAHEVADDLSEAIELIRGRNPSVRFIFTVSPVPLAATYDNKHVLTAATYSKAALRVAADDVLQLFGGVAYFPSYEIVTGNYNRARYFADDLREVRPEGVAHVMRLFFRHFTGRPAALGEPSAESAAGSRVSSAVKNLFSVVCEEELLEWSKAAATT